MSAFETVDIECTTRTKLFAGEDSPPQDENGRSSVNADLINSCGDVSSSGFVKAQQQLFGDASPIHQRAYMPRNSSSSPDLLSPAQLSPASESGTAAVPIENDAAATSNIESSHVDSSASLSNSEQQEEQQQQQQQQSPAPEAIDEAAEEAVEEETAAQRTAREERESELLAWQLMQEENRQMYALQQQFMRENSDGMTEEDLQAIQAAIDESGRVDLVATDATSAGAENNRNGSRRARRRRNDEEVSGNEEEEEEEENGSEVDDNHSNEEDDQEDDPENWDYERLLELGHALGDVKTERWRLRAKSVIDSLPLVSFAECKARHGNSSSSSACIECAVGQSSSTAITAITAITADVNMPASPESSSSSSRELSHKKSSSSSGNELQEQQHATAEKAALTAPEAITAGDSNKKMRLREIDVRCAVCMEDFCDEEQLLLLPCKHYFHTTCIAQWMGDHNTCPSCKCKISATPEK